LTQVFLTRRQEGPFLQKATEQAENSSSNESKWEKRIRAETGTTKLCRKAYQTVGIGFGHGLTGSGQCFGGLGLLLPFPPDPQSCHGLVPSGCGDHPLWPPSEDEDDPPLLPFGADQRPPPHQEFLPPWTVDFPWPFSESTDRFISTFNPALAQSPSVLAIADKSPLQVASAQLATLERNVSEEQIQVVSLAKHPVPAMAFVTQIAEHRGMLAACEAAAKARTARDTLIPSKRLGPGEVARLVHRTEL